LHHQSEFIERTKTSQLGILEEPISADREERPSDLAEDTYYGRKNA
jgi:hypothetical protein